MDSIDEGRVGRAGVTNGPGSNKGEVQAPRGEADLISSLHVLYLILSPPFFYFLLFLLCSFFFFSALSHWLPELVQLL